VAHEVEQVFLAQLVHPRQVGLHLLKNKINTFGMNDILIQNKE